VPRAIELLAAIENGRAPRILDVRTAHEFAGGHVPGAINLPFDRLAGISELPVEPGAPVVVYCGHGPRAWIAGLRLRRLGFTQVHYLKGHMRAWRRAGLREDR
jgi:rhodanese-related sulfurtransferase